MNLAFEQMKLTLPGIVLASAAMVACRPDPTAPEPALAPAKFDQAGGYSLWDEPGAFRELEAEIRRADFEFHLDGDDQLIPIGHSTGRNAPGHELRYPGFVVVQLHKLAQIRGVETKVRRVNGYFFGRGAQRVLVTGFAGSGRSIYSDKVRTGPATSPDPR